MDASAYVGMLSTNDSSARHALNRPSSKPVRVTRLRYSAGMIWSVSTSERRRGAAMPVCTVNFSMTGPLQVGRGREPANHGGGGGDGWGDQVGATTPALASFEIAIGGGGTSLSGPERVRIHAQTHGTAGKPPPR